ncbi:MAG: low molecular weight protein-tyrosine-phosphatase [Bacteroidota bacterium]
MKILMVCLGNICRSPLAEGLLQHKATKAGLNWKIDSAGTNGYHNDERPHHICQKLALSNGIDISNQQSRKITKDDFREFDFIYAMAEDVLDDMKRIAGTEFDENKTSLFLEIMQPEGSLDVPDPWYSGEDGFIEVYDLIDTTCDLIIENYLNKHKQT